MLLALYVGLCLSLTTRALNRNRTVTLSEDRVFQTIAITNRGEMGKKCFFNAYKIFIFSSLFAFAFNIPSALISCSSNSKSCVCFFIDFTFNCMLIYLRYSRKLHQIFRTLETVLGNYSILGKYYTVQQESEKFTRIVSLTSVCRTIFRSRHLISVHRMFRAYDYRENLMKCISMATARIVWCCRQMPNNHD